MERIAITQGETRWASVKRDRRVLLNIALCLMASVDVVSRRLLISVLSP